MTSLDYSKQTGIQKRRIVFLSRTKAKTIPVINNKRHVKIDQMENPCQRKKKQASVLISEGDTGVFAWGHALWGFLSGSFIAQFEMSPGSWQ